EERAEDLHRQTLTRPACCRVIRRAMDPVFRRAFNAAYASTPDLYATYVRKLEAKVGCKITFPLAETPLFIPPALRDGLARSPNEILEQLERRALIAQMKRAIPPHLDAPGMDPLPNCAQVDFAIVRGPDGELTGKVVELQAFPSLYALMVMQSETV